MVYGNGFSTIRADLKPIIYCIGLSDDEASRRTKIFIDEIKNTFSEENIHEPLVVRDIETAHRIYDFVERNIDAIIRDTRMQLHGILEGISHIGVEKYLHQLEMKRPRGL